MDRIIEISSKVNDTSIRVKQKTKRELELYREGNESHDQILSRILRLLGNTLKEPETQILKRDNVVRTRYARISRTIKVRVETKIYELVCQYNDLSYLSLAIRNKNLYNETLRDWELNLTIINLRFVEDVHKKNIITKKWLDPKEVYRNNRREYELLYLIACKEAVEDMFGIELYDLQTELDFFSYDLWDKSYKRYNLSTISFDRDIHRHLR